MDFFSRRQFIATAAAATMSARSYAQVQGAGERLRIGVIGCGGMAMGHMNSLVGMRQSDNIDIVAVCDLYEKRAQQAAQLTGGKIVKDYRTLLDDKEIDYVLIATPEHWHYQVTMDALDARKHIYCEKPMTRTVEQSKKVVAKVKQAGVKMQVGVQGTSDESYASAYQYVKDGTLGDIVIAQIDYSRNGDFWMYPIDADAKPGVNLDWKTWLGTTPKRAWDPERFFRWRRYWDYSGGIASDLFVHRVTRLIKAMGLTFPERAVATGGKYHFKQDDLAEVPDTFNASLEYAGGPNVLLVSSMANDTPVSHVIRGNKATLEFTRTGFTITPQRPYAKEMQTITYQRKGAESVPLHHRNLQNAIRKNDALNCDCMLGYYGVVACEMAVESFRKRKYMAWDKTKEKVVLA